VFTTPASYVVLGTFLLALLGWHRGKELLRHDALLLGGILVYFGIGTVDLHLTPYEWSPRFVIPAAVWTVVAWGSVGYLVGAWVARHRPMESGRGNVDGDDGEAVRARGRALRIIGWISLAILLATSGAPAVSGANRERISAYWTALALLVVPGTLLTLATTAIRPRRWGWAPPALAVVAWLGTGYRTNALLLGLSVCVLRFLELRSPRARLATVAAALAIVLALGVGFGYWRTLRHADPDELRFVRAVADRRDPTPIRLGAAYVLASVFREGPAILGFVVDRHPRFAPYTEGRALWGMLTSPLPGEQPDARSIISREVIGSRGTSLVSTIFGPWYLDFGPIGVALVMMLLAYVLGRVERSALTVGDPVSRVGYAYGLVLYGLAIHAGLSDFDLVVLIPLALLWAAGRLSPPPRTHDSATLA